MKTILSRNNIIVSKNNIILPNNRQRVRISETKTGGSIIPLGKLATLKVCRFMLVLTPLVD